MFRSNVIRRLAVLALVLCLALVSAAAAEEDPVIVRVGRVSYPLSLALYSYQSNLDLMAYQGYSPTPEEQQALISHTVDHLVELALIQNKLIEAGRNDLTEAEESLVRSYAGSVYENLWQAFKQRVEQEGYEATEEQVTSWLAQQGYTLDICYEEALMAVRNERIIELYCPAVTVSPEEVEAYYQENYLLPDREAYENDVPRYEREILTAGGEAFFSPEGYRIIRQILLPYPDSVTAAVNQLSSSLEEASTAMDEAYRAVADAALAGADVDAAKAVYRQKEEAYTALVDQLVELQMSALSLVKETTDEIIRKYNAGATFESLIAEYGKETGEDAGRELLFHPDSENWAESFRAAAAALEKPGDITEPFVTNLGIHIVQYQEDAPGGVHELTAEEQSALEASALQAKQAEALQPLLQAWRTQYDVETHPELIVP